MKKIALLGMMGLSILFGCSKKIVIKRRQAVGILVQMKVVARLLVHHRQKVMRK